MLMNSAFMQQKLELKMLRYEVCGHFCSLVKKASCVTQTKKTDSH